MSFRVHVDARRSQQRRDHLGVASTRRQHERRVAVIIECCSVHVEARSSQQHDDRFGVASSSRLYERRPANTICRVHVDARSSQQRRNRLDISASCRLHEFHATLVLVLVLVLSVALRHELVRPGIVALARHDSTYLLLREAAGGPKARHGSDHAPVRLLPDAVIHGLQQAQRSLPMEELEGALVVCWPGGVELVDLQQVHRTAPLIRKPRDIVPVVSRHLRLLLQRGLGALLACR
eukprot:scaffold19782_cov57-Phaeocystis_antarctica.AAC.1